MSHRVASGAAQASPSPPRRPWEREGPANRRLPPGLALWPRPRRGPPASRFPGPPSQMARWTPPTTWHPTRRSPWSLPGERGAEDGARGSQGTELRARKSQFLPWGPPLCHFHLLVRGRSDLVSDRDGVGVVFQSLSRVLFETPWGGDGVVKWPPSGCPVSFP